MASSPVIIQYAPRRIFVPYHLRTQRWAALVAHRRAGKTVACINDLGKRALEINIPHGRFAYIGPYYSQAKEVAWEYLKRYLRPVITNTNESELWVELVNGSRIRIHGGDNPDRLRGAYLDGVILDEYADMRPSIWGEVIRPMLADRKGWATFIGTPKGHNGFYEIVKEAKANPDGWYYSILRASETKIIDEEELASNRRNQTPEQYSQEWECDFEAAIQGAYFGREMAEAAGRIRDDIEPEPGLPVHTAWDLGIGDATAIWFWQAVNDEVRVIDHYRNHGRAIPHYVAEIESRGYKQGFDFVPHDARVRSLETGRTRVETLIGLGRKPKLVPDHKIMDGINAARLTIPRCYFSTRCELDDGLEALRQYRCDYDEKTKSFKDTPKHDWASDSADAFRYMSMAWRKMVKVEEPAPLPPVKAITDYKVDEMWKFSKRGRADRV